ncbi:MAG: hypothetical protein AAB307_02405 [Deltaproteobacteria bacterium]
MKSGTVAAPGVFDATAAMLAERAGFKAVYVSGAGLSKLKELRDYGTQMGMLERMQTREELYGLLKYPPG